MTDAGMHEMVAREIVALHVEFEQWFRGDLENLNRVRAVLADDFTFVSPQGTIVQLADLLAGLEESRGSREIGIRIENPIVHWRTSGAILATYQEWHDHSEYQTTRQTTALFTIDDSAPGGLMWRHVHETWITPPPT